jgi:hypothetical protein
MGPGPLAVGDMVYTGSRAVIFGGYNQVVLNHDTGIGRVLYGHNAKYGSYDQSFSLDGI